MKSTGIVRRIDDLGRVVVPKEIRRALGIREGDPLEVFVENGSIIYRKYYPQSDYIQRLEDILEDIAGDPDMDKRVRAAIAEGIDEAIRRAKGDGMTNFELIKNMSIEELAKIIHELEMSESIDFCKSDCEWTENYNIPKGECVKCVVKWLQEETE